MAVIYKVLSAMDLEQQRMELRSKNLAGTNIPGFKGETITNQDFDGFINKNNPTGQGTIRDGSHVDFTNGRIDRTGRDLDFAIGGEGFFEVETPDGRQTFLTRNGRFTLNADGELVTSSGHKVVGDTRLQFAQSDNLADLEVSQEGEIRIRQGNTYKTIGKLKIVTVDDFKDLKKLSSSLFQPNRPELVKELDPEKIIVLGRSTEGANISTVKEMISMIDAMRKFEMGQKFLKLSDGLRNKEQQAFE